MDKENGRSNQMRMVLAIIMMANIWMIERMDMVSLNGNPETFIKVCILMMREMDMVRCTGLMEPFIKECGNEVYRTILDWFAFRIT